MKAYKVNLKAMKQVCSSSKLELVSYLKVLSLRLQIHLLQRNFGMTAENYSLFVSFLRIKDLLPLSERI